ncbi:glycosyltransferase family 4 protein [Acidaminobacter sp. JC074]|uniref:glycosyltransferase family 4 protein n=1 Tax=Acidaminobacter sp. JC074 TaxID=2530199 RepID=UPI001F0EF5C8|nr:glycosyltransferase family 4 protein [Acidaminobacter sp. JC074]
MNIGIFTDAYYPQINGVVISTQTLKNELERLGHRVYIITVSDPKLTEDQPNVIRLKSIPFAILPNFRVGQFYSHKIMKEIKSLKLDIIHTQTEFTLCAFARIVAKQLDIPLVHTYHTMYEDYTHYIAPRRFDKTAKKITRKLSCFICNTVDNVIVPTGKVEEKLSAYGFKKNINVIPTGVDLKPFDYRRFKSDQVMKLKTSIGLDKKDKIILFVGRLAKEKSIDVLIKSLPETLEKSPHANIVIVGDGPERQALRELAKSLAVEEKVFFTGKVPWDQVGLYYQLADVFVSASLSETQGLTYIEAMAAKKPVVAKYDTNLDETIDDGINGRFFYDDDELPEILSGILEDELVNHYLSKNALDKARTYSSEYFGLAVERIYKETLGISQDLLDVK